MGLRLLLSFPSSEKCDSSEFCMHKSYFAYVKLHTKYTLINLWLLSSLKFLKFVAGECCS